MDLKYKYYAPTDIRQELFSYFSIKMKFALTFCMLALICVS